MKVQFYYADDKYIEFLKNKEIETRNFTCVPNVKYSKNNKFLYGAVLKVNSVNYYVPVSSQTGKNKQYNFEIKTDEKNNQAKGSLRFPYMIPIPSECLTKLNLNDISSINERARISKELAFCRRNKDKIEKYAQITYNDVTNKKNDKLVQNACDFKLLEKACTQYCTEHGFELPDGSV